jgi:hypothetical protein
MPADVLAWTGVDVIMRVMMYFSESAKHPAAGQRSPWAAG